MMNNNTNISIPWIVNQRANEAWRDGYLKGSSITFLAIQQGQAEITELHIALTAISELIARIDAVAQIAKGAKQELVNAALNEYAGKLGQAGIHYQNLIAEISKGGRAEYKAKLEAQVNEVKITISAIQDGVTNFISGDGDGTELHELYKAHPINLSIAEARNNIDFGGNTDGPKQWRVVLAKAWSQLRDDLPGKTAVAEKEELLNRWSVLDNKGKRLNPRPDLTPDELKAYKQLKKVTGANAADYRYKLFLSNKDSLLRG